MADRFQRGFNVKNAGLINTTRRRVCVFDCGNGDMRRRWQIAFAIVRSEIMAALFAPFGTGTFGTEPLGRRHRRTALASKWQAAGMRRQGLIGAVEREADGITKLTSGLTGTVQSVML